MFIPGNGEPTMVIPISSSKITSAVWGPYEEYIITGHENGEICHYDLKSGDKINSCKEHSKQINDLQLSKDMSMLISASKDTTAKVNVHLVLYFNYTPVYIHALDLNRKGFISL